MKKLAAVIIDTFPDRVLPLIAIRRTLRLPNVGKLYTVSDRPLVPGEEFHKIAPIRTLNQYSDVVLRMLPEIVQEDRFLLIQWDGMPVSPASWNDAFLDYDYIGAPWIDAKGRLSVGNGGFSLRSRQLLDAVHSLGIAVNLADPRHQAEDVLICAAHRSQLEAMGLRFAPIELAKRFSYESGRVDFPVYGFHSTFNLPLFISESKLLGFAHDIVNRQSNLHILMKYLENLLRLEMYDLLRVTLEHIRSRPQLAESVQRAAAMKPELTISRRLLSAV